MFSKAVIGFAEKIKKKCNLISFKMRSSDQQQKLTDDFFDSNASYWKDAYKERSVYGIAYQQRQATALDYIDALSLPRAVSVFEIGCGAGLMTAALAKRGFFVEAIDHSQEMINLTTENARLTGFSNRINARIGDVHDLSYEDKSFDLIVGLGVVPWLHDFKMALAEITRVLRPCGYLILTMDNSRRATTLLDPLRFPVVAKIRVWGMRKLEKARLLSNKWVNAPSYTQYSIGDFNRRLGGVGLVILKSACIGYGPFTFFERRLFPNWVGIKIQQRLQEYADMGYPILRSTGEQYIALARKMPM